MTTYETPTIALASVDTEHLEYCEENTEAVQFFLALNQTPPGPWASEFNLAYDQMPHPIKPPADLEGDRLRITYLPRYASELPQYLQFLASVIDRANRETFASAEMHHSSEQDRRIEEFRDVLKRVTLPTR